VAEILGYQENIPDISFIDNITMNELIQGMLSDFRDKYKEITGKEVELSQADPNRLILYTCALQIYQGFQYIDRAGKQNFLKYSYGAFLDNLALLRGIKRKEAIAAKTIIRFTVSEGRTFIVKVPEGSRVMSGEMYFKTTSYAEVAVGESYVDVLAECVEVGEKGNVYQVGDIDKMVDPLAYIGSVSNITEPAGGADVETDEQLAERMYLAPSHYSVAGPEDAYIYWVKYFNTGIGDVKVYSPTPAVVNVMFVMENGEVPGIGLIEQVKEFLYNEEIRPLTDKVEVMAPTQVMFDLDIKYWVKESDRAKAATIQAAVNKAIELYIVWQQRSIGRDINPSQLNKYIMEAGAKRVEIDLPLHVVVGETSVARLKQQNVNYGGIEDD